MDDATEREASDGLGNPLLNLQERFTVMTKEEMFKEMKEMEPVLGRGGIDIVLGKRIPGSFTMGYFFNEEAGLWEVYFCGERNDYSSLTPYVRSKFNESEVSFYRSRWNPD